MEIIAILIVLMFHQCTHMAKQQNAQFVVCQLYNNKAIKNNAPLGGSLGRFNVKCLPESLLGESMTNCNSWSNSARVLSESCPLHLFMGFYMFSFYHGRVEQLQQGVNGPPNLKYLLLLFQGVRDGLYLELEVPYKNS